MDTNGRSRVRHLVIVATLVGAMASIATAAAPAIAEPPDVKVVTIGHGITLHYVESGQGEPVVFVHGSLGDGSYWNDELEYFGNRYHAIAYSRRYNVPNNNPLRPGYSAIVDASDLADLIDALHLGPVHVVGHSYGALTALFLAAAHPELVRTLVLAEAPAVSLLARMTGPDAAKGRAAFDDIQRRMVGPMKAAFARGDREAGVTAFIDYVFDDPQAWSKMSADARADTMKNAREWDAMMTTGVLFPELPPDAVRKIAAPTLLVSGDRSYPFLHLIDEALLNLLPHARQVVVHGAGHQMWLQAPDTCRNAVLELWRNAEDRRRESAAEKGHRTEMREANRGNQIRVRNMPHKEDEPPHIVAELGTHTKSIASPSDRVRLQRFYRDVLGCHVGKGPQHPGGPSDTDLVRFANGFSIVFQYSDVALSNAELKKAIWLELLTDNPAQLEWTIQAFGIEPFDYFDKDHFYFQAPGGQVFRVAGK